MQPSIDIRNVSKSYGGGPAPDGLLALDDVSLQIGQGEFLAILGPSGCGKSTLLHVVAGLTPARGELSVHGKKVTGPGLDRGVVFQDYALFPWRTVLDNVAFGLEMKKVPRHLRAARAFHPGSAWYCGYQRGDGPRPPGTPWRKIGRASCRERV